MSDDTEKRLDALCDVTYGLRFDLLKCMARVNATIEITGQIIPEELQEEYKAAIIKRTKLNLQKLLESYEKVSPGLAAQLDMRGDQEITDLE